MGQRAHNRRHEGRAIRKERREMMAALEALPGVMQKWSDMAEGFMAGMSKLVKDLSQAFDSFAGALFGYGTGHDVLVVQEEKRSDYALTSFPDREVDPECVPFGCEPGAHAFRPGNRLDVPAAGYSYEQQREFYEEWKRDHPDGAQKPAHR